ncbi:hypothetical protein V1478_007510 [Vespula squamosa]|uniref:Uncharacterized protein n=1 Tax=Vespula squamosa TaxID=30214 RepID=A0ABD2B3C1_VESSQ
MKKRMNDKKTQSGRYLSLPSERAKFEMLSVKYENCDIESNVISALRPTTGSPSASDSFNPEIFSRLIMMELNG